MVKIVFEGHTNSVTTAVALSEHILTASSDFTVQLYDLAGERVRTFEGHGVWVCSVFVRDDWLVTGSYDKTARLWRLSTGEHSARQ